MPTVALAIAGASLTPSPITATLNSARSFLIAWTLSSGIRSPQASSSPTCFATASATRWLSPEIMIMRRMPMAWSRSIVARAASRGVSIKPMRQDPDRRAERPSSYDPFDEVVRWRLSLVATVARHRRHRTFPPCQSGSAHPRLLRRPHGQSDF